jgi:hypothetical protein
MSLISHSNRFCFLHIPRTGGTTIVNCLKSQVDDLQIIAPYHSSIEKTILNFKSVFNYFTFSYVRNPYDLLVSIYSSIDSENKDYYKVNKLGFFDFIVWMADEGFKREENDFQPFYRTQTDYLSINNELKVKNLFKYELLCNDSGTSNLLSIMLNLNLRLPKHIPLTKKSDRFFNYNEYYDYKTFKLVNTIYKEDFKNFKYSLNEF